MKRYFYLQLKRTARIFPFLLIVTAILIISVATILFSILSSFEEREENKRFSIALSGDTDNEYLSWGIAAMANFDETRFSIDFVEMDEKDAKKALESGKISAYVILPDNFVDKALSGNIEPITYVTTPGMEGINTLFKREITSLVTDIVVYSQKGTYGLNDALDENGFQKISGKHMDGIALEYVELIFKRNELYSVTELGISDGLSTPEYYVSAMTVTLLAFMGIPFGAVYIKKDMTFSRLLKARGYSSFGQLVCEYGAHLTAMLILTLLVACACFFMTDFDFILKLIPCVMMLCAFNMLIFELSDNTVSGILLHFFLVTGLCYLSGCFYPVNAFPDAVRDISSLLPNGIIRGYLAASFTGETANGLSVMLYCTVFFALAWLVRIIKTKGVRLRG